MQSQNNNTIEVRSSDFTLQHAAVTWRPLLPDEPCNEADLDKAVCRANTRTERTLTFKHHSAGHVKISPFP